MTSDILFASFFQYFTILYKTKAFFPNIIFNKDLIKLSKSKIR